MKCPVVAVGGMSRSGTNYANYVFYLHPDIKGLGYVPHHLVRPRARGMTARDLYHYWRRLPHSKPLPFYSRMKDADEFRSYHLAQANKDQFLGVTFKDDFGEQWYKDAMPEFKDRCLIIYCVRKGVVNFYRSWKGWGGEEFVEPFRWLEMYRATTDDAYILKERAAQGLFDLEIVSISEPHEHIKSRFLRIISEYIGEIGPMQYRFLEKRRPLADGISTLKPVEASNEELLRELQNADSNLKHTVDRYESLLSTERWH